MQNEGGVQRRLGAALALISQKVKVLFLADGAAHVSAKLVKAECIEAGRGEQIIRVQFVIAEEFVDRTVNVIASGLCDRVHHRPEIAPVVGGIGTADDAEFPHPVLRWADALHSGNAGRVVGPVEAKEIRCGSRAALQNSVAIRVSWKGDCAPTAVLRPTFAVGVSRTKSIKSRPEIGRVGNFLRIDNLADFRFLRIHALCGLLHIHILASNS